MFKRVIITFFTFIGILYLTDQFINGFDFKSPSALLLTALTLSIAELSIKPVIKFFTLPINFLTFGIFNFIISCMFIYLYVFFINGFRITDGSIGPFYTSSIQIPLIKLSMIGVIIIAGVTISFLHNLINWTLKDS